MFMYGVNRWPILKFMKIVLKNKFYGLLLLLMQMRSLFSNAKKNPKHLTSINLTENSENELLVQ